MSSTKYNVGDAIKALRLIDGGTCLVPATVTRVDYERHDRSRSNPTVTYAYADGETRTHSGASLRDFTITAEESERIARIRGER